MSANGGRPDPIRWVRIRLRGRRAFAAEREEGATGRPMGPTALTLGLPVPLIVMAFVLAAAWGLLLTYALSQTTPLAKASGTAAFDDGAGGAQNLAAPVVVTESTLGPEVQRLVESGSLQSAVDFDVPACLAEQGITDKVLIMEEVHWGQKTQSAWLIVHSPLPIAEVRARGGTVGTAVVLSSCGTHHADPSASRLWSGSTVLAAATG